MHDVRVAFNNHFLRQADTADLAYATGIVTPKVDQHQVLGQFLGVTEQILLELEILLRVAAARARAGWRRWMWRPTR